MICAAASAAASFERWPCRPRMRCLRLHGRRATILQHFYVVVGLQDEDVCASRALEHELGNVTEVGDKTKIAGGGVQQKSNGILCIMGNGRRCPQYVGDFEARAGFKKVAVEPCLQLEFKGFFCRAVAINRDVEFLAMPTRPGHGRCVHV